MPLLSQSSGGDAAGTESLEAPGMHSEAWVCGHLLTIREPACRLCSPGSHLSSETFPACVSFRKGQWFRRMVYTWDFPGRFLMVIFR